MIAFWALAGLLCAAAAGLILFRAAQAASQGEAPDPTPVLYRRQLAEIDDLAERGLIAEPERKSAHAEAARRLLAASDAPSAPWTVSEKTRWPVWAAVVAAPALALGVYLSVGAPGTPDQPFAQRMVAWKTADLQTLRPDELAAVLHDVARKRPDDPELLRYIAMAESAAQNPAAAVRALRRAIQLAPNRADLWTMLGEAQAYQAGEVDDAAQEAFRQALVLDPKAIEPRFYLGRARILRGDRAGGIADWKALLAELPANDERRTVLTQSLAEAEAMPQTPSLAGDQMAAIRGMVEGLAGKLKENPDDAEGWVRLVRAYAVLGETAKRDAALKTAQARFASRPDVLDGLKKAAAAEPMQ